jgi:hypothetical protein
LPSAGRLFPCAVRTPVGLLHDTHPPIPVPLTTTISSRRTACLRAPACAAGVYDSAFHLQPRGEWGACVCQCSSPRQCLFVLGLAPGAGIQSSQGCQGTPVMFSFCLVVWCGVAGWAHTSPTHTHVHAPCGAGLAPRCVRGPLLAGPWSTSRRQRASAHMLLGVPASWGAAGLALGHARGIPVRARRLHCAPAGSLGFARWVLRGRRP